MGTNALLDAIASGVNPASIQERFELGVSHPLIAFAAAIFRAARTREPARAMFLALAPLLVNARKRQSAATNVQLFSQLQGWAEKTILPLVDDEATVASLAASFRKLQSAGEQLQLWSSRATGKGEGTFLQLAERMACVMASIAAGEIAEVVLNLATQRPERADHLINASYKMIKGLGEEAAVGHVH